jgi:hypothetical protein
METFTEESLVKLKVTELKEEFKKLKLPIYGTKLILVQRLLEYKSRKSQTNEDESPPASTPISSQSFFSYSLERLEHEISDVDVDADVDEATNLTMKIKEKKKRKLRL